MQGVNIRWVTIFLTVLYDKQVWKGAVQQNMNYAMYIISIAFEPICTKHTVVWI